MADLVKEYYFVLRRALRTHPRLRCCLTRCRHCRIFFLTHPRNAKRKDLGCPFGCRETHRKRKSTQRSVAYYGDAKGKALRRIQNGNRQFTGMPPVPEPLPKPLPKPLPEPPREAPPEPPSGMGDADARPAPWPTPMLRYLRMVISLIEERPVSRKEIWEMLGRILRQHRMAGRRPIDHIIEQWHEHPP